MIQMPLSECVIQQTRSLTNTFHYSHPKDYCWSRSRSCCLNRLNRFLHCHFLCFPAAVLATAAESCHESAATTSTPISVHHPSSPIPPVSECSLPLHSHSPALPDSLPARAIAQGSASASRAPADISVSASTRRR